MLQLRQFIIFAFGICLFFAHSALAQTEDIPGVSAPDFTAQSLEQRIEILKTNEALSAEQRAQAEGFYRTATDRLSEATRQAERRSQYLSDIENIVAQREALDAQIETAQAALEATTEPMGEMIGEGALFALEQDLIARESELAEVETQLTAIIDAFQALIVRQSAAPKELAESRSALGALQAEFWVGVGPWPISKSSACAPMCSASRNAQDKNASMKPTPYAPKLRHKPTPWQRRIHWSRLLRRTISHWRKRSQTLPRKSQTYHSRVRRCVDGLSMSKMISRRRDGLSKLVIWIERLGQPCAA